MKALKADRLYSSRNMLSQKMIGYNGEASVEMDCSQMSDGQRAGLFCIGGDYNGVGIIREGGQQHIYS